MKKRSGLKVMLQLIGLVKPLTGYMLLAIGMGYVGHLCAIFITILGAYGVLAYVGAQTTLSLKCIGILVCVLAVLRGIFRYGEQTCNHYIAFRLLALIRDKVFQSLRRLCPAKLEGKGKGNLISVITSDIELLEVFYAHTISPVVIAFLSSLTMCGFLGSLHPVSGLLALAAYLVIGMVIPIVISASSGDAGIRFRNHSGELSSFILDSLRGLKEIIQYGTGEKRLEEMKERMNILSGEEQKMKRIAGRNGAITNTVIMVCNLVMLYAMSNLYWKDEIGVTGMLISVIGLMSSYGPCIALANLGSTLQNTFAAGNRVLDILEEEPVVSENVGKDAVSFHGAVAERVTFSYGEENVLTDVSVTFPKGSIVGIIGKSGCGKSTLLKLFMRFWNVTEGEIRIADTSVKDINTENLREMESFVTQQTHVFHDSIRNNLRIAKLDATDEEIEIACKKASLHDFIRSLPDGYDTQVGELGDTLSGGERQRLGLARAFLHDAPFMLLDEPTSNLDSLNEAVILKALSEEHQDKTVVLVSHRQSTVGIADQVYEIGK